MDSSPNPLAKGVAHSLERRQQGILALPTSYQGLNAGPKPAIIVAIVLGSVVGFLLVLWLVAACISFGGGFNMFGRGRTVVVEEDEVVARKRRGPIRETRTTEEVVEVIEERSRVRRPARRGVRMRPRHEGTRNVPLDEGEDVLVSEGS